MHSLVAKSSKARKAPITVSLLERFKMDKRSVANFIRVEKIVAAVF